MTMTIAHFFPFNLDFPTTNFQFLLQNFPSLTQLFVISEPKKNQSDVFARVNMIRNNLISYHGMNIQVPTYT